MHVRFHKDSHNYLMLVHETQSI